MIMDLVYGIFNYLFFWLDITNFLLPQAPRLYENFIYWFDRLFL